MITPCYSEQLNVLFAKMSTFYKVYGYVVFCSHLCALAKLARVREMSFCALSLIFPVHVDTDGFPKKKVLMGVGGWGELCFIQVYFGILEFLLTLQSP